jgi:hypothetical protein
MSEELLRALNKIQGKYQRDVGIVVWGQIEGTSGTYAKLLVKSDGTVKVEGTTAISGTVDVSDRMARLLGKIDIEQYLGVAMGVLNPLHTQIVVLGAVIDPRAVYGSQTQQLKQRASTYELLIQLASAGSEIDPRSIRALVKATDEVYSVLRTDAGAAYDARDRNWALAKTTDNVYAVLKTDAGTAYDARDRSWTITENLARSWTLASTDIITAYGSQTQALLQRSSTYDLYTALRQGGSELSTTNPIFAGIVDASGNRMPSMDASGRPGYVDVIDRAARLLGVAYGSQGQQLKQTATNYNLQVELATGATLYDARTYVVAVSKYLAPTHITGGNAENIWVPASGKTVRLKRLSISTDTATRLELRWGTSAFESHYLPANGNIVINFTDCNDQPAAGADTALTILSTVTAWVTATATGDDV